MSKKSHCLHFCHASRGRKVGIAVTFIFTKWVNKHIVSKSDTVSEPHYSLTVTLNVLSEGNSVRLQNWYHKWMLSWTDTVSECSVNKNATRKQWSCHLEFLNLSCNHKNWIKASGNMYHARVQELSRELHLRTANIKVLPWGGNVASLP